ncbi:MAG: hypothetical protein LBI02_05810, partial [Opitutaceae bacterium]|nr:hypothetical protein [Opitutaceae bacterium]
MNHGEHGEIYRGSTESRKHRVGRGGINRQTAPPLFPVISPFRASAIKKPHHQGNNLLSMQPSRPPCYYQPPRA